MKRSLTSVILLLSAMGASAGFEEGVAAYGQGDYTTALAEWQPLAEKGLPSAQYNVGLMHLNGLGVPKDAVAAHGWIQKAAELGDRDAQQALGVMYSKGKGIPQDDFEAVNWYRAAALQGSTQAAVNLAIAYTKGQGTVLNDAEATKWFRYAAERNSGSAQYWLGRALLFGKGVEKDAIRGYAWLNIAAAALVPEAAKLRDFAREQLSYDQVIEAQELSRELWEEFKPQT